MPLSRKRVAPSDDESDSAPEETTKKARTFHSNTTDTQASGSATADRDANGDPFWELSDHRRLTVSAFKGRTMVSIREYYEKDGAMLPGKKGITLPVAQFAALIAALPDVEASLKQRGEKLPRPHYDGIEGEEEDLKVKERRGESRAEKEKKRNFEETSEED